MTRRRVAITGIGAVTPVGAGRCGLWEGVRRGESAVGPITRFDASQFRSRIAAEISDFDPLEYMQARDARRLDRFAQMGVAAALQAVDDAELDVRRIDRTRAGVAIGSALGGVPYGEEKHVAFLAQGVRAIGSTLAVSVYGGAGGANIAISLDLRGPNIASSSSCASGAVAIGEAFRTIQRGDVDVMLAGGVEAPLAPLTFGAFSVIKAMSARNDAPQAACRPFDSTRDGFVMAEGSAVLVLEALSSARRRGARVLAEVIGYGQSTDAYHMTAPRPDGVDAARAICLAMRDARIGPESIDYVNAHATGTPLGDTAESRALHHALGASAATVPTSGTKALYGHALGASGAIEAAITAMAINQGFLPGTLNLSMPDRDCGLELIPPCGLQRRTECALSTSFGFGGINAALVFSHHDASGGSSRS